jgi:hypothetical protein
MHRRRSANQASSGVFPARQAELARKRGRHRQERAVVVELLYRYSGVKQRMTAERFEGLVSRDRRAIREKIETEPKIRKWFQALTRLSPEAKI